MHGIRSGNSTWPLQTKGRLQVRLISNCNSAQVSLAFPKQESAIEAAIQAGQQKIDVGFERGPIVVNG